MIKNINTIQNIDDEAVNRYIVHALANMGQRGMFENHGFSYKTMSFFDLLNEATINLDLLEEIKEHPENWCGAITENIDGALKYYIISKAEAFNDNPDPGQESSIKTLYTDVNFNNCITLDNDVVIDTPIADIVALRKDTLIYNANDYIIIHGKGLINGNNPNAINTNSGKDATFFYAKYDVQDQNKLLEYYRTGLISINSNSTETYYACSLIKNEETSETTTYTMNVYVKTISNTTVGRHKLMFNDNESKSIIGSIDDIKNINMSSESSEMPTITKVFNLIKNNCDSEQEFEDISISTVSELSNDYNISIGGDYDVAKLISDVNNTKSLLLYDLLSYHNSIYYTASKACLTKRLLGDLYFDCKKYADDTYGSYIEEYNADSDSSETIKNPILYVPFDLDLHYVSDASDELKVYYTNTIYVLMCNMLNLAHDVVDLSNNLIFDYDIFGDSYEINSYDMQVYYNDEYNDIISDMSLKHIYSMPSIRDGQWYINGVETGISARGFDAGNPNMLVMKFNTDDMIGLTADDEIPHPEILNTISSKYYDFKNKIDYYKKIINIEYQGTSYTCEVSIPVINDNNAELIRDTLLLYYITTNISENGQDPCYINLLTFWYPTSVEYQPVLLPGDQHAFYVMSTNEEENDIINLDKHYERLENLWNDTISYLHGDAENVDKLDYAYVGELRIPISTPDNATGHELSGDIDYVKITNNTMDKYTSLDPSIKYINNTNIVITPHSISDIGNNDNYKLDTSNSYAAPVLAEHEYELCGTYVNPTYMNVPTMSLENIILKNTTFTNRINVLCIDKDTSSKAVIYNAYIGTSKNDLSKSTIHIGTSTSNINLNTKNTNNNSSNEFNKSTQLSIDLPTTIINSSVISEDAIPVNKVQRNPTFDHGTDIYNITIPICGYLDKSNYAVLYEAAANNAIMQSTPYSTYKDNALYYIGDGSELVSDDNFIFKMCDIYVNYTISGARLTRRNMISYDECKEECLLLFNPYKLLVNQIKFIDFDNSIINIIINDNGGKIKTFKVSVNNKETTFIAMSVSKDFINNFTDINSGTDGLSVIQCVKEFSAIQKPFIITGNLLNVTIRDKGSYSYDIVISPQKDFYVNNTLGSKKYGIKRLSL